MSLLPPVVPPLSPARENYHRDLPVGMAFKWLAAGGRDMMTQPASSLVYGVVVLLASVTVIVGMGLLGWEQVLFPALAGFMVVGPIVAVGLYEKSRRIALRERATLANMIFVKAASGSQILFIGALLVLLMLLWMRAAVIIYALFFGLRPFPGLDHIASMLLMTPVGWSMLIVGGSVGALFAALSFSISIFAVPMLLDKDVDAFTAMGTSMALVWNNLPVMVCWGLIVATLFALCVATGLLALVVVFPLLGHASWHAYKAVQA
ncbi:MAG: hypothetical protein CVT83_01865 [Alphaproteobacteria bacterium HGW-Alphaproteobacteria-5]|nr:MAG: hypothetical protein CVT83_01865 [Alphaproteobacteria bacterium HGW-Alphaproteobacteria-5]